MEIKKPIVLKTLQSQMKYAYFLKNENIDNNTYIVQKAFNIPNALYICDIWEREGYNIMEIDRYIDDKNISYTKYLYNKNTDITKIDVNEGSETHKILLYKKDGKINVCSLLKFDEES